MDLDIVKLIDIVCQLATAIIAPTAVYFMGNKVWWAPALGISQQPFWYGTAVINRQWFLLITVTFFTIVWAIACYKWIVSPWLKGELGIDSQSVIKCPQCGHSSDS